MYFTIGWQFSIGRIYPARPKLPMQPLLMFSSWSVNLHHRLWTDVSTLLSINELTLDTQMRSASSVSIISTILLSTSASVTLELAVAL